MILTLLISLACMISGGYAWWDGGHMLVAAIARLTLEDENRLDVISTVNKILSLNEESFPNSTEMDSAATWMDHIKVKVDTGAIIDNIQIFNNLHYMDVPLVEACLGVEGGSCPTVEDSVTAYVENGTLLHINELLSNAFSYIEFPSPNFGRTWGTALYVRFLLHLIGDAHMPLHMVGMWFSGTFDCTAYCTSAKANAQVCSATGVCKPTTVGRIRTYKATLLRDDQGGNQFKTSGTPRTSLHGEWDSMGGYETRNLGEFSLTQRNTKARELMAFYPRKKAIANMHKIADDWTLLDLYSDTLRTVRMGLDEDGFKDDNNKNMNVYTVVNVTQHYCPVEINIDYCPKVPITQRYQEYVQAVSKRQVALAGYRLATILKRLVDNMPERLLKDIGVESRQASGTGQRLLLISACLFVYLLVIRA